MAGMALVTEKGLRKHNLRVPKACLSTSYRAPGRPPVPQLMSAQNKWIIIYRLSITGECCCFNWSYTTINPKTTARKRRVPKTKRAQKRVEKIQQGSRINGFSVLPMHTIGSFYLYDANLCTVSAVVVALVVGMMLSHPSKPLRTTTLSTAAAAWGRDLSSC